MDSGKAIRKHAIATGMPTGLLPGCVATLWGGVRHQTNNIDGSRCVLESLIANTDSCYVRVFCEGAHTIMVPLKKLSPVFHGADALSALLFFDAWFRERNAAVPDVTVQLCSIAAEHGAPAAVEAYKLYANGAYDQGAFASQVIYMVPTSLPDPVRSEVMALAGLSSGSATDRARFPVCLSLGDGRVDTVWCARTATSAHWVDLARASVQALASDPTHGVSVPSAHAH